MKKMLASFLFAFNGLHYVFRREVNFRIEILCAAVATAAVFLLQLSGIEATIVCVNIGIVLSAEIFNTAIERLCDVACKDISPAIKVIKDAAAGAVVVSIAAAGICGAIIFIPHIINLIKH